MIATTPSGSIDFVSEGPADAPAVLLLHALGATRDLWDAQAAALARDFRVIRFDLRGHGRSSVPGGDYTVDGLGQDALTVLDTAGIEAAHIAGISLGALISLWLGIHAAPRVTSLFIANTAARVGTVARWEERIAMVESEGLGGIAERTMGTWFTPEFIAAEPAAVARCRSMIGSTSAAGYLGCCAALRDADLRTQLSAITARSLVVAGQHDVSSTVSDAREIADAIAGARLVELPCAHMSIVEERDAMTRLLKEWTGRWTVGRGQ